MSPDPKDSLAAGSGDRNEAVRFVDTHGQLPPMWDRRAIFFANLLAIFYGNEKQTNVLAEEVGELDSYSARLIPILNLLFRGDNNLLVVERSPDQTLCDYFQSELGLSLPRIRALSHSDYVRLGTQLADGEAVDLNAALGNVDQSHTAWMDGYVTDDHLTRFASQLRCRTISSSTASHDGNNKGLLHRFLVSEGLPALDTVLAESSKDLERCAAALSTLGYRSAIVRAQIGASGIGMLKWDDLRSSSSLPTIPNYFFHEGPCLVQGWLAPGVKGIVNVRSPSTQLFLDEHHVYAFDLTEQILSQGNVHEGNESPPPYLVGIPSDSCWAALRHETMRQAKRVGGWLHRTGYRGTASIDWLVVRKAPPGDESPHDEHAGELEVYVCEINARVTGATYPSVLAKHFHPSGAWLLRNLRLGTPTTPEQLLNIFRRRGHLFLPERRCGILPLNFNFGRDGLVHKGQFVCIGSDTLQCHHFLELAEKDLPGSWKADRD